ncbi:MmgE/PrpD family protein [Arthrobacter sp. I2-34]|uniref:MmgE/PrpD family protein n=1 Tax=Arthrobacter hankyongi TaxID=2904801 RepID=A0ABS9L3R3_9MICC|nr:MmgE/PrpD family protein [Arthrobacter hankyongi]MCG2621127.1 MmgE/PrpD family protein [Arthrobacter hankyongi]
MGAVTRTLSSHSTTQAQDTVASKHARFIVNLSYDQLPEQAIAQAKSMLVDGLACGLAATRTDIGAALQQWLPDVPGAHAVLATSRKTDARSAVLTNGTLMHALDFDDIPHFAAVELPPALAIAETREVTGEEVIVALVAGFEVAARVTTMLAHGRPQHPIGTAGAIGAAAVAAKLLKLDEEKAILALSIAASMSSGLTENFGTFTKPLHAGRAAEAGYLAATLAQSGWTADPGVFEGRKGFFAAYCDPEAEVEVHYGSATEDFWITRVPMDLSAGSPLNENRFPPTHTGSMPNPSKVGLGAPSDQLRGGPNLSRGPSFKPWPACGGNNAVLTAMFSMIDRPEFDRGSIAGIEITVPTDPERGAVFRTWPQTPLEGKFSLPYGIAAAWLDGKVTVDSYEQETFDRIQEAGLLSEIALTIDPDFIKLAPAVPSVDDCNWAAVTVRFDDGSTETSWAFNRGVEMGTAAVDEKFVALARPFFGDAADRLVQRLRNIDEVHDIQSLLGELYF